MNLSSWRINFQIFLIYFFLDSENNHKFKTLICGFWASLQENTVQAVWFNHILFFVNNTFLGKKMKKYHKPNFVQFLKTLLF